MVEEIDGGSDSHFDDAHDISEEMDLVTACEISAEDISSGSERNRRQVLRTALTHIKFYSLPNWMQDNDFLHGNHRPQLYTFAACFQSIFQIHSETGNIWTHLLGCVLFLLFAVYFLTRPEHEMQWEDKFVFIPFFFGAIACMGLSFVFHTLYCHSEAMCKLFNNLFCRLDYTGISLMTIGSFIPWLYYAFYCNTKAKIIYMTSIFVLCSISIYCSLDDEFMTVAFRPYRVGLFVSIGISATIPALHCIYVEGFWTVFYDMSLNWIMLVGIVYCSGAFIYVCRFPERFFPGQCDIWFQSHQIFHVAVVLAAFIHYHGIRQLAEQRIGKPCEEHHRKHAYTLYYRF